jgi:poly-gamma-glutamate synthesis protein (capsule biosynthesis protein)
MSSIKVAMVGDMMINRPDPMTIYRRVEDVLRAADLTYGNLEGPMCDTGELHPGKHGVSRHHRSVPSAVNALVKAGFDVVSLANNHALDYGIPGMMQTMDILDAAKIAHAGAGRNVAEARRPVMLSAKDIRVAMLSYTSVGMADFRATDKSPGVVMIRVDTTYTPNLRLLQQPGSPMMPKTVGVRQDVDEMMADVREARKQADVVLVSWHWGVSERWGKLADYQQILGRALIDAGAHAVIGHHAHMLLGIEHYRGKPIFYSLGNFGFDLKHPYFRPESVIVECDITRDGIERTTLLPIMHDDANDPELVGLSETGLKVLWTLEELSEDLNTRFIRQGDRLQAQPLK